MFCGYMMFLNYFTETIQMTQAKNIFPLGRVLDSPDKWYKKQVRVPTPKKLHHIAALDRHFQSTRTKIISQSLKLKFLILSTSMGDRRSQEYGTYAK